jgi:hypothetical protein
MFPVKATDLQMPSLLAELREFNKVWDATKNQIVIPAFGIKLQSVIWLKTKGVTCHDKYNVQPDASRTWKIISHYL